MSEQWVPTYHAVCLGVNTISSLESRCFNTVYQRTELQELSQPLVFKPLGWVSPEEKRLHRERAQRAAQTRWENKQAARERKVRERREQRSLILHTAAARTTPLPKTFTHMGTMWPRMPHTIYTGEANATCISGCLQLRGFVRTGVGVWELPVGRVRKVCFFNMDYLHKGERLFRVTAELI